ncbi:MAG: IreB family regulatory phosphoprotein [Desulfotomaculales bacterium]
MNEVDKTVQFSLEKKREAREILLAVYEALKERGYNPINQIIGYLLSGDPAYITSHKGARSMIRRLERDELLEELLRHYLERE